MCAVQPRRRLQRAGHPHRPFGPRGKIPLGDPTRAPSTPPTHSREIQSEGETGKTLEASSLRLPQNRLALLLISNGGPRTRP